MNIFDFPSDDFNYITDMAGDDIQINSTLPKAKALINNLKINRYADIRTISSKTPIKRGDYITWQGNIWLVISEIASSRFTYYKGIIQRCNFNINFNFEGIVKQYPCILESRYFDIDEGKYISTPTGKVLCIMPFNKDIKLDQRFIKHDTAFKILGNDFTRLGLSVLHCERDTFNSNDDRLNEIADADAYNLTLTITNGESVSVDIDDTLQLLVQLKSNDTILEGKTIIYESSDDTIASVNDNGMVTALNEGNCTIKAYLEDMPSIMDSITITTESVANFTYEIEGNPEIKINNTHTFTANKYLNGVLVEDAQFDFEFFPGSAPSNAYTFTILNDTQCTIKCLKSYYVATLRAIDRADSSQFVEVEITLRNVF